MLPFSTIPNHVSSTIQEQFEKNSQRHLLACDLEIRARRMARCFANITGTLPLPNNRMRSVWNLLPNETTDKMPMPLKANIAFLLAPPPTAMDTVFALVDGSSPRTQSDDISRDPIYETTRDTTALEVALNTCISDDVSSIPTSEACPSKMGTKASFEVDESAERGNEDLFSSDVSSNVSSQFESPVFAPGFEEIVNDKLSEMRVHGSESVVQSLLSTGAQSVQSAPIVSMVVRTMLHKMTKESATQAQGFEKAMRVGALEMFRRHWKFDGDWRRICSTSDQHSSLTLIGVNKAGLMGALFCAKVVTAQDIAICLSMLLEEIHFDRLCAMHAMLLHADDRLCKTRNLAALNKFKEGLSVVDPVTDMYLWAPAPHARALLQDIFDAIEGWMAVQASKRERYHESYSSRKQPPVKAVGPRLRHGRARNRA